MTRDGGLQTLEDFLSGQGAEYAGARNTDRGRGATPTTSALSPYLRRRLVTEHEVAHAAVRAFSERGAEKFVSEVFWRTYFKGYLETHPGAWNDYLSGVLASSRRLDAEPGLSRTYEKAVTGRTGIDGYDDWVRQLVEDGWLHNHTRMWFASIWIFTLHLPWELGADLFMRHLLDGDPASNTLSWRWVAGLHTRGRHYLARAENIRRFTDGRYDPADLDEHAVSLDEPMPPREVPLAQTGRLPAGDVALLLHLDDLHPESLQLGAARVARVGAVVAHAENATALVRAADEAAMADALTRASAHFACPVEPVQEIVSGDMPVVTAWAPIGPSCSALPKTCLRVRRGWDEAAWPFSTRGFSRLRGNIPRLMATSAEPV